MKNKYLVWSSAAIGLAVLGFFGYRWQHRSSIPPAPVARDVAAPARGGQTADGAITVEAARVATATLIDDLQAVGSIRANESVMLRPEISGRIAQIRFREGQRVAEGDVLVALDDSVPRAELAQAEAQLALAQSSFDRTADLEQQKFVSASAKDQAAATLKVQEAARVLARTRLAKSTIRAPFGGIVGMRLVAVGDYVKEGQDMVAIEDTATVKVDFRIPERYLAQVRTGQRLIMETDSLPQRQFGATVELVDPKVDSDGRSVLVRGRVANPAGLLRAGMFARVRLVFDQRANALTVPEEAIVPGVTPAGSANFVYKLVGEDGAARAVRTRVETGLRRNAAVEIRSGLVAGDRVVTAGQIKLRGDEVPVRVRGGAANEMPGAPVPAAAADKAEKRS